MTVKRTLRSLLALLLAAACLFACAACSTPKVAMKVGGKVYEMGDYLAYALGTAMSDSNAYIYLSYYGEDALSMDFVYGEGDDEQDVTMEEYLILTTRDMMVRQKALEDLLDENGLKWDEELEKAADEDLKDLETDAYLSRGFTNERYIAMYKAFQLNESSLFDGLYNKGGLREVAEEEIRKYFDENYLSYYLFEVSLVDDEKAALSDEIIADYQTHFNDYLAAFNKTEKTADDFQVIYRQFLADTAEEEDESADTADVTADTSTDSSEEAEEETTSRVDVVKEADGVDEDLVEAVEEIEEGAAKVVTYKKNGTTNTMALIFRMDPEAGRDKDVDYYEDSRDQTLQYMKYDEFDAEVSERADELMKTAEINNKALHAIDYIELIFGND